MQIVRNFQPWPAVCCLSPRQLLHHYYCNRCSFNFCRADMSNVCRVRHLPPLINVLHYSLHSHLWSSYHCLNLIRSQSLLDCRDHCLHCSIAVRQFSFCSHPHHLKFTLKTVNQWTKGNTNLRSFLDSYVFVYKETVKRAYWWLSMRYLVLSNFLDVTDTMSFKAVLN